MNRDRRFKAYLKSQTVCSIINDFETLIKYCGYLISYRSKSLQQNYFSRTNFPQKNPQREGKKKKRQRKGLVNICEKE